MYQKNRKISPKNIKLALLVLAMFVVIGISWWQYKIYQQSKELKLIAEHERASRVLREAGLASVKVQQTQKKSSVQEDDELAPHELSDEAELAQARLWQTLPKDKRAIMQAENVKAGLAAGNKQQPLPNE
jgi:cytoskeletal protein RodZ